MLTLKHWPVLLAVLIGCVFKAAVEAKVYERCELAKILRSRHRLDTQEIAQWVCIAQHSSGFNTAAQAYSATGGSHGLFQISDVYWCSPPGQGSGCNVPCHKLRDDNLADDLACVKRIYDEHQRISGDGYTAWNAYQQYCKNNAASYIQGCFPNEVKVSTHLQPSKGYNSQFPGNSLESHSSKKRGKIYNKCELARELYQKHKMPMEQVPTWVCIAEHESRFNTAAVGRLNTDGSADHGLFQISDLYWCAHDRYSGGKACGLSCNQLLDDDITDDVRCVKRIHNEHTAISGDGFNAWTVYKPHCQNQRYDKVASCFSKTLSSPAKAGFSHHQGSPQYQANPFFKHPSSSSSHHHAGAAAAPSKSYSSFVKKASSSSASHKGKIYTRCSLAQELYFKHNFPMQDISTWVCIAEHESQFNTAAVGRLNTDGSADHGLFQISDRYWCSHDSYGGKACDMPCEKLLDEDLRDDVKCIKIIHEEHTRISGDGFNAWTVYQPHCMKQNVDQVRECFDEKDLATNEVQHHKPSNEVKPSKGKGKIYKKCELAQELYHQHQMPMEQIPKWVCVAQHESSFNTAAVGRLNTDGSADHGLFQISDLYWCSHDQYGGKACNIPCDKLLDSDISDDVRCIKIIHEEHTRISGDGFNAWTVYKPHCRNTGMDHIKQCFTEEELKQTFTNNPSNTNSLQPHNSISTKKPGNGKIYKKCELAQELYHQHQMPMEQIPKWVCIAQHESSFNTAAVGRLNTDGSADHGIFQISDLYWCSHDQYGGKACNIPCDKLLDSDISDDIRCIKIIHEEHTRISGDGFNAWTVYKPHCRSVGMDHIKQCFTDQELKQAHNKIPTNTNSLQPHNPVATKKPSKGKIYKKCELAQELYNQHQMPMEQIPKWVCIAQHESSFNTAAVGRLNTDGSADHGLFQISDLYWCSHDQYGGKACNIPCDKLLDSDISDDVRCIKIIHEEHTRISGDGFNAWTVYKPHCHNTGMDHIKQCFTEQELKQTHNIPTNTNSLQPYNPVVTKNPPVVTKTPPKGKIYKKCELAQELLSRHKMPMEQIPTWVCIAQYESSFNTAAVGRLNTDGSADHGLFQISDLYWCSHDQYGGKACNIPCDKLLDSDIADDVKCIKIIHEEHTRISGDGFNAWTVYKPHCQNRKMEEVRSCFSGNEIDGYETNLVTPQKPVAVNKQFTSLGQHPSVYGHNPFLSGFTTKSQATTQKPKQHQNVPVNKSSADGNKQNYANNPFLQNSKTPNQNQKPGNSNSPVPKPLKPEVFGQAAHSSVSSHNYLHNPFLNSGLQPQTAKQTTKPHVNHNKQFLTGSMQLPNYQAEDITTKPSYNKNPFLNGAYKNEVANNVFSKPFEALQVDSFKTNPFLNGNIKSSYEKPTESSLSYQFNPFLQNLPTPSPTKNYFNSQQFRTTTAKPPTTTTAAKPKTTTRKPTTQAFTTKLPITTTTRKSTTTLKTTTKTPLTSVRTTNSPKTTTTWSWQNQKYASSTTKPATIKATTTKPPKTSITWNWQNQKYTNPTTKLPKTTTSKPLTTWNWQNQNYAKTTTKPTISTTTKLPQTTKTATTRNWQNQRYSNTTKASQTTTKLYPTTKRASTTTTTVLPKTTNWNTRTTLPTTTVKSQKTTWNWRNDQATKTPTTARALKTTTKLPTTTTTANWRVSDKTTNKATTKKDIATTKPTTKSSWHWLSTTLKATTKKSPTTNRQTTTTTKSPTTKLPTTTKPTAATTKFQSTTVKTTTKPLTTTIKTTTKPLTTTRKPTSTTKSPTTRFNLSPTKPQATRYINKESEKTKTTKPTATQSPTTTSMLHKSFTTLKSFVTTTLKPFTTKPSTLSISDYDKYKKDPFSHPFFAKVNEQIRQLRGNTTTTKLPPYTAKKLQSFPNSTYYQDYKNSMGNKTKTIVSYNFNAQTTQQPSTTKRPRF